MKKLLPYPTPVRIYQATGWPAFQYYNGQNLRFRAMATVNALACLGNLAVLRIKLNRL